MINIFQMDDTQKERLERLAEKLDFSKDVNYLLQCLHAKDEDRCVFIASQDGTDCGLCILNFRPIYPMFRRLGVPEIQDVNVAPSHRRAGVGAALIGAAEDLARARGAEMVGIGVGLSPPYGPAQRLYVRLGYVPDGAGVGADDAPVRHGDLRAIDDRLCLWMVKGV